MDYDRIIDILASEGYWGYFEDEYCNNIYGDPSKKPFALVIVKPFYKTIKLPQKKEVTLDYIMDKLSRTNTFKNFTDNFRKIIQKNGMENSYTVYPTTYGIGVSILFRSDVEKQRNTIDSILNEYGIVYTCEYSSAHWVFRYKISKAD